MIGRMLLTPWLLAVTLALLAVVAIPTRRLFVAGVGRGMRTTYLVALVALGLLAASGRGPGRLLVPCFVAAPAAPLVASPALIRRVMRRGGRAAGDGPPRDTR
jgi:hypothetical protein